MNQASYAQPTLAIHALRRRFGEREILRGLDLTVSQGDRVALLGPNGSGKTTMLRCVAGTLEPTSGSVRICGHRAGSVEARRSIGVSLSQERSFYMRLSGRANLLFFARVRGRSGRAATQIVSNLEDELELHEILAERADRCSSGMLQQLALARALLAEPPLLLLDEPTRSLDDAAQARFWAAVDRRPQSTFLIATHLESDVERCERRVALAS